MKLSKSFLILIKELMIYQKLTLSTAESCTGGLISSNLTRLNGSSSFYRGGVNVYSNEAKNLLLGITELDIETYGVVSHVVAEKMADNIRRILGTDYSIATTGYLGTSGGDLFSTLGTSYIAISGPKGTRSVRIFLHPKVSRSDKILYVTQKALELLESELT